MSHGETRISGRKRGIFGNRFIEQRNALVVANHAILNLQRAGANVQIIGLGIGLIAPLAIDDAAGNLVLDGENVRELAVKPAGPKRKIVARSNELDVDP